MSEEKKIVNFRLSESGAAYIGAVADKHQTNKTQALELILQEHREQADGLYDNIVQGVMNEFEKRYANQLTHVRLSTNYTDKNTQILMEMLNTLLYSFKLTTSCTSSKAKNPIWTDSEEEVNQRIARFKQLRDNQKKKKQG